MFTSESHTETRKVRIFLTGLIVCLLMICFQGEIIADGIVVNPSFEETSFTLTVDKGGTSEIPAVISGKNVYLSINALFTFLKIKNSISAGMDTVSGYFLSQDDPFLVNLSANTIWYKGKETRIDNTDIIITNRKLYLSTRVYQDIFGLGLTCSLKNLTVDLHTRVELPVVRTILQEEKRKYIRKQEGQIIADTTIRRSYPIIHLGAADWAVYSTQFMQGGSNTRATLNLGGYLAGLEAEVGLNYYSFRPFLVRDQFFRLRYVNNENPFMRQVIAGNITPLTISSIYSNILGFQVTNSPTTYRKFYGTYKLSDKTEPGWVVELYVNNTLIDYVKADASGFFTFEVPLSYGNTEIDLRFYGPWGEEKSRHKNILVPYTFLPKHDLEYNVSAGVLEDSLDHIFCRASFNYGLSRNICIGGGNEYLSSIKTGKNIPFLTTSFGITKNFLFTGEADFGVREFLLLSYRIPSNSLLELSYTHYDKGQTAIYYNYREELRGSISLPLRFRKFSIFSRLSFDKIVFQDYSQMILTDLVVSAAYKKFSGNLHTYGFLNDYGQPNIYSDVSLGFRLPKGFTITPSVRFDHVKNVFTGWKCILEKPFCGNGFFTVSYEQYPENKIQNLQIGFRYLFPFAQVLFYANHYPHSDNISEAATGSLVIDPARSDIKARNINKVGRGGITVLPFLDINGNGKRDNDEPKVSRVTIKMITGGLVEKENKDTLTRIYNLEPYVSCLLEANISHVENISWQLLKKSYSLAVEPNMMRLLEIPVSVLGEVSGRVVFPAPDAENSLRTMKVLIYQDDTILTHQVNADQYGNYSYLGLRPGNYTLMPDTALLQSARLKCSPASRKFSIRTNRDGDVINDMNFTVEPVKPGPDETMAPSRGDDLQGQEDNTADEDPANSSTSDTMTGHNSSGQYAIQMGSFIEYSNAMVLKNKISSSFSLPVDIVKIRSYYSVMVTGFQTSQQATAMMKRLTENGYQGIYIRLLKDGDAL